MPGVATASGSPPRVGRARQAAAARQARQHRKEACRRLHRCRVPAARHRHVAANSRCTFSQPLPMPWSHVFDHLCIATVKTEEEVGGATVRRPRRSFG